MEKEYGSRVHIMEGYEDDFLSKLKPCENSILTSIQMLNLMKQQYKSILVSWNRNFRLYVSQKLPAKSKRGYRNRQPDQPHFRVQSHTWFLTDMHNLNNYLLWSSKFRHHLCNYWSHFGVGLMLCKISRVLHYCKTMRHKKSMRYTKTINHRAFKEGGNLKDKETVRVPSWRAAMTSGSLNAAISSGSCSRYINK